MTAFVLFKAVLELREPGGVRAPEQRSAPYGINLPLARTPQGNIHVPATSVVGSFRAHLFEHPQLIELLGDAPDTNDPSSSALRFLGTRVTEAGHTSRGRTAIDRDRAAPANTTLYRAEMLNPGSQIEVFLHLEKPALRDEVVAALQTWQPYIGGGRTIGYGRSALIGLRERALDLTNPDDRRTWLTTGGPELFNDERTDDVPLAGTNDPPAFLEKCWRIVDGLHIGDGRADDTEERIASIVYDHEGNPVVPGSTWKGVLRSRCEFILRTLDVPACAPLSSGNEQACGSCLICHAFGWTTASGAGRRGALAFAESPIHEADVVRRKHNALDRVTGGTHDRKLYAHHVVESGTLTLRIDHIATMHPAEVVHALITLACHDIHHGLVGIGGSTTRGFGTLQLEGDEAALVEERRSAVRTLRQWLPELQTHQGAA